MCKPANRNAKRKGNEMLVREINAVRGRTSTEPAVQAVAGNGNNRKPATNTNETENLHRGQTERPYQTRQLVANNNRQVTSRPPQQKEPVRNAKYPQSEAGAVSTSGERVEPQTVVEEPTAGAVSTMRTKCNSEENRRTHGNKRQETGTTRQRPQTNGNRRRTSKNPNQ